MLWSFLRKFVKFSRGVSQKFCFFSTKTKFKPGGFQKIREIFLLSIKSIKIWEFLFCDSINNKNFFTKTHKKFTKFFVGFIFLTPGGDPKRKWRCLHLLFLWSCYTAPFWYYLKPNQNLFTIVSCPAALPPGFIVATKTREERHTLPIQLFFVCCCPSCRNGDQDVDPQGLHLGSYTKLNFVATKF